MRCHLLCLAGTHHGWTTDPLWTALPACFTLPASMGMKSRSNVETPASLEGDAYFSKATRWRAESEALRTILIDAGLTEAIKWGKPCYAAGDNNIAIIQKMKDFLALMFFKGVLLADPDGLLEEQGENSHSARRLTFRCQRDVLDREAALRNFIDQAIDVEKHGRALPPKPKLVLVDEIRDRLAAEPKLKAAFEALTPGRQREFNLFVSSAKQSSTRARRFESHVPTILAGKGLRDS